MRSKRRLSPIYLVAAMLAACGGGGDPTDTGSDPATGSDGNTSPSPSPAPSPSPSPSPGSPPTQTPIILSSSEGAAPGLVGCLNKGLYSFGEVDLSMDYRLTDDVKDPRRGIEVRTAAFRQRYLNQSGSYEDAIFQRQIVGTSIYTRLRLTNNTIYTQGTNSYGAFVLNPEASAVYFDLDVGETRRNSFRVYDGQIDADNNPRLTEATWDTTYLGRATINVPAGTFVTCRVDYGQVAPARSSWWQYWYAVGSGVLIKGINYQTRGSREGAPIMTFTRELMSATIGNVPIRP